MGEFAINVGVIIQARMGSSRLPGKVLRKIGDEVLLGHVLNRVASLHHSVDVIVATSCLAQDDAIDFYCREHKIHCFRGSETNVLERYYQCAVEHGFEHIVRLTADNPFYDSNEMDSLIQMHLDTGADFSHSFASLPIGVGAEIFSFQSLEWSYQKGHEAHHIEHVDEYMLEHPEVFDTHVYQAPPSKRYPGVRLTVDTMKDYERACAIVDLFDNKVSTEKAIQFCLRSA
jgi:spore coat polysaccharide biosynthesis protein SpsF